MSHASLHILVMLSLFVYFCCSRHEELNTPLIHTQPDTATEYWGEVSPDITLHNEVNAAPADIGNDITQSASVELKNVTTYGQAIAESPLITGGQAIAEGQTVTEGQAVTEGQNGHEASIKQSVSSIDGQTTPSGHR